HPGAKVLASNERNEPNERESGARGRFFGDCGPFFERCRPPKSEIQARKKPERRRFHPSSRLRLRIRNSLLRRLVAAPQPAQRLRQEGRAMFGGMATVAEFETVIVIHELERRSH